MLSEYPPFSYDYSDDWQEQTERAVATLGTDVIIEMNRISQAYPEAKRSTQELAYVTMDARLSQLEVLTNVVIDLARGHIDPSEPFYLIDDTHFKELEYFLREYDLPELYVENQEACRQAIRDGMRAGADDMLRMLVPEEVVAADSSRQSTYFIPWRKDLLEAANSSHLYTDGASGFEVVLPTKLPEIYVVQSYAHNDASLPIEEIRLIRSLN